MSTKEQKALLKTSGKRLDKASWKSIQKAQLMQPKNNIIVKDKSLSPTKILSLKK